MEKNFFITGATRGIGLELTRQLLTQKHQVIATGRSPEKSSELKSLQKDFPNTLTVMSLDVSDKKSINELTKKLNKTAAIDCLVNNAGIFESGDDQILEKVNPESVLKTFVTNVMGPLQVTQVLLPLLKKSKSPIVANITSQMGSIEDNKMGRYYGYRMSKTALNMFAKSLSVDYSNIITLSLHPGWVKTDMGGTQAPTLPSESAAGLIKVIIGAKSKDSGKFLTFEGKELPW